MTGSFNSVIPRANATPTGAAVGGPPSKPRPKMAADAWQRARRDRTDLFRRRRSADRCEVATGWRALSQYHRPIDSIPSLW